VLLIIFMVITPMMSRGREVKLPKTSNHYQLKDKQQPVVAIDYDAKTDTYPVYYDKEKLGELSEPGVEEKLADKIQRGWTKVKTSSCRTGSTSRPPPRSPTRRSTRSSWRSTRWA
jgi:biopolymer transport protein ExbD